jgi:glycosyltransferase involved in cell wall biosynthesis
VRVVPTTIYTYVKNATRLRQRRDDHPPTIGWTGSYSTVHHLDTLRPVLQELSRRHPYRLRVIGTPSYHLDGVETVASPWRAESEVEELQRFDVGIMPLPDDDWSQGKCGLKLLQCMGVGVPAVGSPIGVNSQIIQDGVNGFLAGSDQEWLDKLSLLMQNLELRQQIGTAGRRTVEHRYSARVWAPRVRQVLESVAAGCSPVCSPTPQAKPAKEQPASAAV